MLVASFLFSCIGMLVKLGAAYFSSIELVFYRSLGDLCASPHPTAPPSYRALEEPMLARIFRSWCILLMFFFCIVQLPLATAVTLNYTAPLFLALFTTVILKEHFHRLLVVAVVLGFVGVTLLLRPILQEDQWSAGLIGLFSGFLSGVAYLNVKKLGSLGESDWQVVFYFSLICTAVTGGWMLLDTFHALTLDNVSLLLGIGITATFAQLALARAYRTGRTLVVGALAYSTVIFSSLWGILIWNDVLPPSTWLGMGLIVASGLLSLRVAPPPVRE